MLTTIRLTLISVFFVALLLLIIFYSFSGPLEVSADEMEKLVKYYEEMARLYPSQ